MSEPIPTPKRPTSFAEMRQCFNRMHVEDGDKEWRVFQPRPTDVIISPYGKSGTTWLQQIVHGLRTGGDMDFDDISRVVPWLETSYVLGIDINAEQRANPRAFKSHLAWDEMPKGGRYIVSIRDPKDVFISSYRFAEGWFFEPGSISITEWAEDHFQQDRSKGGYGYHLRSWWEQRQNENVLLLSYEGMRADLPGTIRRVAHFSGIPLDDRLFATVLRQSSFEFMLKHKDRFDDSMLRERSERIGGLPPGSDSAKVRKGEVSEHTYELTPAIVAKFDEIWREEIEEKLGFASYQALRKSLEAN